MAIVRPKRLKEGDTVGVVSPSWGGPHAFPKVYDNGKKNLEELFGLKVKEYSCTRAYDRYLRMHPQARARDINEAFLDPETSGVFASIGGDDSIRTLPYLDYDSILASPKVLLGFSDTTTALTHLNQLGMVTFQGPSVMAGFSQMRSMPKAAIDHVRDVLFSGRKIEFHPFPCYSEGYPDWKDDSKIGLVNRKHKNRGWHWIQGDSRSEGRLFGGCFEVLEMMKGTRFWPTESFWKDKILFLETSEIVPTIDQMASGLRNYGMQGVFDRIGALFFGRPRGYSSAKKLRLEREILAIVAGEFGREDLPIVSNMDFGHTDPQLIIPLGCMTEVNPVTHRIRLLESPVE